MQRGDGTKETQGCRTEDEAVFQKVFCSHALQIRHNLKCYWEAFTEKSVFVVVGFFVKICGRIRMTQKCVFFCFVYCSREKLNQAECLFVPWMCGERHYVAATSSFDLDAAVRSAEWDACRYEIAFLES